MQRALIALVFAGLMAVACGGAGATTAPAAVTLASSPLGQIVVDSAGRTLYAFTPDEATGQPTCADTCAANWPAATVTGTTVSVGTGLDQAKFSTVTAPGSQGTQIKFGSWPLYRFANDAAAGQTNGQGVGEKWYVVGADGNLIQ